MDVFDEWWNVSRRLGSILPSPVTSASQSNQGRNALRHHQVFHSSVATHHLRLRGSRFCSHHLPGPSSIVHLSKCFAPPQSSDH